MTTLLEPTRTFPAAAPRTTALPAAGRSAPDSFRTTALPSASTPPTVMDMASDGAELAAGRRGRRTALVGVAVLLAGAAVALGMSTRAPLAPLPASDGAPASTSACGATSCQGLDPTDQGCQQDARTVADRVVTVERRGIEVPAGVIEVRASATCHATWARYTLDPTAPVGEVTVESRDGRAEHADVAAVAGHRHVGYGTTPMVDDGVDEVRAVVTAVPGGVLPSDGTAWARAGLAN